MEDPNNNSRKRTRDENSPTPSSGGNGNAKKAADQDGAPQPPSGAILAQRLMAPGSRNHALNALMRLTSSHETNYSLDGDSVLKALSNVFCDTIGWEYSHDPDQEDDKKITFEPQQSWIRHTNKKSDAWARFCKTKLRNLSPQQSKRLEAVLVILRNLSFVAANLRLLAYSPDTIYILVGCLYESTSDSTVGGGDDSGQNVGSTGFLSLPSLHVLVNLAPYLDVTGQKLLCDKMFLSTSGMDDAPQVPAPATFGQLANGRWGFGGLWLAKRLDAKEDVVQDVSTEMLLQLTQDYIVCVWTIFPALAAVLTDSGAPRLVIMTAVDLLQEFINHARVGVVGTVGDHDLDVPNARSIVVNLPDDVMQRLMDLLYIPRLGPDALEYIDPVHNIVTRVTTLKLLVSYDAQVDTDLRDRALDVLVPLLELDSPNLAKRIGTKENGAPHNRLYDAIFPILATQVGRNEAPLLASQLLQEISKANENEQGCLYLQRQILSLASKDSRVAHLAFNYLIPNGEE
jgi:hypothetical protein